jgi:hypothetical protein
VSVGETISRIIFLILIFFSTAISTYIKHLSLKISLYTQGHT